jgi:GT2 family glycosyltransferase
MFFSIIIPTANRNNFLQSCLEKLDCKVQGLSKEDYEIIVTDDGKENQAKELIKEKFHWVQWIEGPKCGPAANRNNGAKYAKGEWLIFLDDDVLPDENILNSYKQGIEQNSDVLAFEGGIIPDDWDLLKRDMAECPVNTEGGCFWSANICIQKKLFNEVGGFDEQFSIAAQEDQDLFERLKIVTEIRFLKKCHVMHEVRFIPFRNKIRKIPKGIINWYLFEKKRKNFLLILFNGTNSQCVSFLSNLKHLKLKSTLCNVITLIVLLPILVYCKLNKEI